MPFSRARTRKGTRHQPRGAKYTGPPIQCDWPGCPSSLKTPASLNAHSRYCLGLGLPPLDTGIKCSILDCYCEGVEFPSTERLARHEKYVRISSERSRNQVQCLAAVGGCACGEWVNNIEVHIAIWRKKQGVLRTETEHQTAKLQVSKWKSTRSKEQEERLRDIRHVSDIGQESISINDINKEQNDENQLTTIDEIKSQELDDGKEYITSNETKSRAIDYSEGESDESVETDNSEGCEDPDFVPDFDLAKVKKSTIESSENRVFDQPAQPLNAAKRKRTTIDLTGDSEDETPAVKVMKKIRTSSSKVCYLPSGAQCLLLTSNRSPCLSNLRNFIAIPISFSKS